MMVTGFERLQIIEDTRRELARCYNAYFAGAPVLQQVLHFEKALLELLG